MKKLLIATLIAGSLMLTACDDKEKTALTEQAQKQAQTIEQLNAQVDNLQKQVANLTENQAIRVEPEVLFQKSEVISPTRGTEDASLNKVKFDITMLKTNSDWLNTLLLNEIFARFNVEGQPKIEDRQQLVARLENDMAETLKEAKEYEMMAAETKISMAYLGQRENLATFTLQSYSYSGGAHGMYSTDYITVDLDKKAAIKLDDIFAKPQQEKMKALLWNIYQNEYRGDNGELQQPFTAKADFYVSENFYFAQNDIVFVYPPYAIGAYAEGEKELRLSLYNEEVKALLTPAFEFLRKETIE